jgi:L-iditol 2-dehydrogenase
MREVRLHGPGDLRMAEVPEPEGGDGLTVVRITDVGLCGSDLHWYTEGGIGDAVLTRPVVPGHEMAGIARTGPHTGRRVALDPAIPCETCPQCQEGNRNLCPTVRFAGHGLTDGGLQDVLTWPSHLVHPLDETMTGADGAMLEPLGVALHAWDLSHAPAGADVAVVGCGPIGLLLVQLARSLGARRVVAVEPLAHRRGAAARCGADVVVAPGEVPPEVGDVPVVFEVAGTDDAIATALSLARPGARVLLAGIPEEDRSSFPAGLARRKGLTLVMVRRMKEMYPRATDLVRRGLVDVRSLVSDRFALDDADAAFRYAASRAGLKVAITLE